MTSQLQSLWQKINPPIPETVRDEFALLSAQRLQTQSRLLFLAMALTIPMVLYASTIIPGSPDMIRYGIPVAMFALCMIGYISLLKDQKLSESADKARKFINEAIFFSATICMLVSIWCIAGWLNAPSEMKLYFPLTLAMGSLTTIYNLSTIRLAALLNILIGIVPITILMILSFEPISLSAAGSMMMVTAFLFRLITQQNDQFVNLLTLQQDMKELAETDPLTGLYNRRALTEHLENQIATADDTTGFVVALVDLDGFKPVNDRYGHAVGDQLLVEIGKRLRNACGDEGFVARVGGDEFAVLLNSSSRLSKDQLADSLLTALIPACHIEGEQIRVGASTGVAHWPEDGNSLSELMETADNRLYQAKAEIERKGFDFKKTA